LKKRLRSIVPSQFHTALGIKHHQSRAHYGMDSISLASIENQNDYGNKSFGNSFSDHAANDGSKSFTVVDLAATATATSTGMRDDILLLSWLIVLLRTREGDQITFEWAFQSPSNSAEDNIIKQSLRMNEVITGLKSNVQETAAAISQKISTARKYQHTVIGSPVSLLLSTSFLSKDFNEPKNEVSEHYVSVTKLLTHHDYRVSSTSKYSSGMTLSIYVHHGTHLIFRNV